jgi:hypothetical protein
MNICLKLGILNHLSVKVRKIINILPKTGLNGNTYWYQTEKQADQATYKAILSNLHG